MKSYRGGVAAVAVGVTAILGMTLGVAPADAAPGAWKERQNGKYHLVVAEVFDYGSELSGGYYLMNKSSNRPLYLQARQLSRYNVPTPPWTRLTPDNVSLGNYAVGGWSKKWRGYGAIGIRVCEVVNRGGDVCSTQYVAFGRASRGGGTGNNGDRPEYG